MINWAVMNSGTSRSAPLQDGKTRQKHVPDRNRQQQFPADGHELVVAEARQRAPHPDVHKQKNKNLGEKPERSLDKRVHSGREREQRRERAESRADDREHNPAEHGFVWESVPDQIKTQGAVKYRWKEMRPHPNRSGRAPRD